MAVSGPKPAQWLAILGIATVGLIVSSAAIANPALAKSNNNSVSKSDIRDVGKFLQCIASHGGNDISKNRLRDMSTTP